MNNAQQCIAISKWESRCQNPRVFGTRLCTVHSGQLLSKGQIESTEGTLVVGQEAQRPREVGNPPSRSIRIVSREGRSAPTFFCDECEKPIKRPHEGLYLWDFALEVDEGEAPLWILHKRCHRRVEDREGIEALGTMELDYMPFYLLANLGIVGRKMHEEAAEGAGYMSQI